MQLIHNNGVYLASGSPRRAELLAQIGVSFDVISVDVDETVLTGESAETYVVRLATKKAKAGYDQLTEPQKPVLGADTAIYISETENTPAEILGKPQNFQDAHRMMTLLSGRTHQVFSAVALVGHKPEMRVGNKAEGLTDKFFQHQHQQQIVQISDVTMREITDQEIEAYWQTQEPQDKAGGYGIQGLAAIFILKLEGSYSGVMGLPLFETANLISNFYNEKVNEKK